MERVTVVATERGYDGITVREPGEEFQMPADVFNKRFRKTADGKLGEEYAAPSWFKKKEAAKVPVAAPAKKDGSDLA